MKEKLKKKKKYIIIILFILDKISIKSIDINELKKLFEAYVKKIYEKDGDKYIIK